MDRFQHQHLDLVILASSRDFAGRQISRSLDNPFLVCVSHSSHEKFRIVCSSLKSCQEIQQMIDRKSLYVYEMPIAFVKKYLKLPRFAAVRYTCLNPMQENQLVIGGFTQALHEGSLGRNVPLHLSGPVDTVPNAHDEKPIHLGGKKTPEQWLQGILRKHKKANIRKQVPEEVIRMFVGTMKIIPLWV